MDILGKSYIDISGGNLGSKFSYGFLGDRNLENPGKAY